MNEQEKTRLQNFFQAVQQYIGRDLSTPEALVLATIIPSLQSPAPASSPVGGDFVNDARLRAGQILDAERQRVTDTMKATLGAARPAAAIGDSQQENATLAVLNQAASLQQLQQAGQAAFAGKDSEAPAIVQIGTRLMDMIKEEVERCFQEQFGPLNQQMTQTLQSLNDWMALQGTANPAPSSSTSSASSSATTGSGGTQGSAGQQSSTPASDVAGTEVSAANNSGTDTAPNADNATDYATDYATDNAAEGNTATSAPATKEQEPETGSEQRGAALPSPPTATPPPDAGAEA